jgi:predicted DNA-binding protein with PD1-like motif
VRTLTQPGAPLQPRRLLEWAAPAIDLRVRLAGDQDLLHGLVSALADRGVRHAAVQVLAADIARMAYLTGAEDPSGARVATYGPPTRLDGPVTFIGANGILGPGPDGDGLLHCHAVVVDAQGRLHGGHLPPGRYFWARRAPWPWRRRCEARPSPSSTTAKPTTRCSNPRGSPHERSGHDRGRPLGPYRRDSPPAQ